MLNVGADVSRWAGRLNFGPSLYLPAYIVCACSEGSGETCNITAVTESHELTPEGLGSRLSNFFAQLN